MGIVIADVNKLKSMSEDKLLECQSRAYLGGLSTCAITFGGLYFVQSFATRNWRSRSLPLIVGSSALFAGVSTYLGLLIMYIFFISHELKESM